MNGGAGAQEPPRRPRSIWAEPCSSNSRLPLHPVVRRVRAPRAWLCDGRTARVARCGQRHYVGPDCSPGSSPGGGQFPGGTAQGGSSHGAHALVPVPSDRETGLITHTRGSLGSTIPALWGLGRPVHTTRAGGLRVRQLPNSLAFVTAVQMPGLRGDSARAVVPLRPGQTPAGAA